MTRLHILKIGRHSILGGTQARETITPVPEGPALRLSNLADVLPPFRRPDDRNRYIEALRMAGLPE
ncbi:hypothetical protein ELI13_12870 [Rhizobium ruizarguesonis]|uniref:Uncharacterized protein n=1 Tax=Rhizobium ruizarguesonis TaxID=2081791 RepID=A0AAE8U2S6_9HYPH|nr:hypothetical protein [Rhizobium leguminosarum bv. viciae]TAT79176.1 hypothetical protein ELI56_13655 [Rhizobium ruizarguesonis]NKL11343.1 hypothetical protein [Rhizobium leguminosarum bv. viciae]NKL30374.1 hypothetical protein [Rhizobium leguminosarum bv. viciae]TAT89090.1 hypothetical protein ELI54_13155 [Rhizobium ruizarguesonis]